MASLQHALYKAMKMHRPAVIKHTLYGGYEAIELNEEAFEYPVSYVIGENFEFPTPMNLEAGKALAGLIWDALGYVPPEAKTPVPKFLRKKEETVEEEPEEAPKPKLKLKKKLKKRS